VVLPVNHGGGVVLVVRRTYPACVELLTIDPPDH
jgi:hypothetical protein